LGSIRASLPGFFSVRFVPPRRRLRIGKKEAREVVMLSLLAAPTAFNVGASGGVRHAAAATSRQSPTPIVMQSLAEQMFGDVFKGIKSGVDAIGKAVGSEEEEVSRPCKRPATFFSLLLASPCSRVSLSSPLF
jgi:hypothetical protein